MSETLRSSDDSSSDDNLTLPPLPSHDDDALSVSSPARSLVQTRGSKTTQEYTISIQPKDDKTDVVYLVLNNREEKVAFDMRFSVGKRVFCRTVGSTTYAQQLLQQERIQARRSNNTYAK